VPLCCEVQEVDSPYGPEGVPGVLEPSSSTSLWRCLVSLPESDGRQRSKVGEVRSAIYGRKGGELNEAIYKRHIEAFHTHGMCAPAVEFNPNVPVLVTLSGQLYIYKVAQ